MSHLGALITPFVDGELSPARAADARAHLSVCVECRSLLALERTASRRTQESVRGVEASAELTARLLAMPGSPMPLGAGTMRRTRRTPFVLGGGVALVGLFVLTLVVLGAPRPDQHPSALLASVADGTDTADAAALTPRQATAAVQTTAAGWALPVNQTVQSLDLIGEGEAETLDVVIDTAAGEVRLLERVGTLDDRVTALGSSLTIAGHTAYLVDGWYVLESGPCVVAVLGESDSAAEAVIAQLPAPSPDGVLGRLVDGWHVLVG